MLKASKVRDTRRPGGTRINHVQTRLWGYCPGKLGEVNVPVLVVNVPPHSKLRVENYQHKVSLKLFI